MYGRRRGYGTLSNKLNTERAQKARDALLAVMGRNNFVEPIELVALRGQAAQKMADVHELMNLYQDGLIRHMGAGQEASRYDKAKRLDRISMAAVGSVFAEAGYFEELLAILGEDIHNETRGSKDFLTGLIAKIEKITRD